MSIILLLGFRDDLVTDYWNIHIPLAGRMPSN